MLDQTTLQTNVPDWKYDGHKLIRTFSFKNFTEAFAFMMKVAFIAEKMDHHPNWSNVYNIVEIQLFTHSKQAVTTLDMKFAQQVDLL